LAIFSVRDFGRAIDAADQAASHICKLEAALKCRSCNKGRYAPPVHMMKLAETREVMRRKLEAIVFEVRTEMADIAQRKADECGEPPPDEQ
jgi:predicted metal-binding protein